MPKSPLVLVLAAGFSVGLISAAAFSSWAPPNRGTASGAERGLLADPADRETAIAIDLADGDTLDRLSTDLATKRVVYVGETHDRYDHHLNQLAIIRGLHERGVDVAVGMEFFQEPFQAHLDQYVAGEIPEKALLKRTEYYERWRYDFRLYRAILEYAQRHRIPLVALNAPSELVAKVSQGGLGDLPPEDRARLPADLSDPEPAYQARLRPIFEAHGKTSDERFRRFVEVQMLWDEHMARVARDYLVENPGKVMVVLAGSGHVAYPDAIPGRLARMLPGDHAVVVTGPDAHFDGGRFDVRLAERDADLPPRGRLGIAFTNEQERVILTGINPEGPAAATGLQPGDRVLSIAGETITGPNDITLALLDRGPGEQVWVEIERPGEGGAGSRIAGAVTLF